MADITAGLVKQLREKSGAGMMDCKAALVESDGDLEAAVDWLRTKGLAAASKKAGRVAAEGLVACAVAGPKGVVVEVNSETDFVARNDDFQAFVSGVADVAAGGILGGGLTCAVTVAGDVMCWGLNIFGQVGAETTEQCGALLCSSSPVNVSGFGSSITE